MPGSINAGDSTGVSQRDLASFFIMIHQRSTSEVTTSSILTCISETFHEFYSSPYNTNQLVADAKKSILNRFHADLESNYSKCNKYKLLMAMLDHTCYGTLWTGTIFIFLFPLFSDFIGIFFFFSFLFFSFG